MIYLLLFYEFFKIGLFAIGGGLAALPFLFDLLDKYDWYTTAELTNMIDVYKRQLIKLLVLGSI